MHSHISRPKIIGLLILLLPLLALMIYLVTLPDTVTRVVGGICAVIFGICVLLCLRALSRNGPQFVVDDAGIHDLQKYGYGLIPWGDIRNVSIGLFRGMRFLCIDVVDPAAYRKRLPRAARGGARVNAALGVAGPVISLSGLSPGIDEVWEYLVREYPERIAGNVDVNNAG